MVLSSGQGQETLGIHNGMTDPWGGFWYLPGGSSQEGRKWLISMVISKFPKDRGVPLMGVTSHLLTGMILQVLLHVSFAGGFFLITRW